MNQYWMYSLRGVQYIRLALGKRSFSAISTLLLWVLMAGTLAVGTIWYSMRFHWRHTHTLLLDLTDAIERIVPRSFQAIYWVMDNLSIAGGTPYAFVTLLLGMITMFLIIRRIRIIRYRIRSIACIDCGYWIGASDSKVCPECGKPNEKKGVLAPMVDCNLQSPVEAMKLLRFANIIVNGVFVVPLAMFSILVFGWIEPSGQETTTACIQSVGLSLSAMLHIVYCWMSCRRSQRGRMFVVLLYSALASNLLLVLPAFGYLVFANEALVSDLVDAIGLVILILLNLAAISESRL